jgi:hypothetical protein
LPLLIVRKSLLFPIQQFWVSVEEVFILICTTTK